MTIYKKYGIGMLIASSLAMLATRVTAESVTQADAAAPADASGELETIVVTANRREENLQNVPISVAVVSGSSLSTSGVTGIVDLGTVVAGLDLNQHDGFINTHLRGVGSSIIGPGLENPIAIYVDGVYYASSSASLLDFLDVADVQVLKGPQGTLFGRNATGGLIQVTTKTPTQDFHLDTDITYGNYQTSKADFYVSGGVYQNLAADFVGQISHQGEGFGRNIANGLDVYKDDVDTTLRSKWVYTPLDVTKLTMIFDFSHARNSDNALVLNPGTLATPASATYRLANPWDTNTNSQPLIENTSGGISLHLDQDLGFAHLSDILAYRRSETDLNFDLDFTPLPEEGALLFEDERQFSEELQLSGKVAEAIQWAAGVFYFDALGSYVPPSEVTLGTTTAIALQGYETTHSIAGYTQGTAAILPDTNLTLGFRYTSERRGLIASQSLFVDDVDVEPLPSANTAKTFVRPTYRIALDHRLTEDVLAYASFNTGFKSGGFNTQVPTDPPFNPETLKAYEIGLKNDLFERRVRANIAAFYYDYTNIQEQHLEAASSGVINGPPAKLYGVDVDLEGRITSAFRVGGGLEYLHSRFVGSTPPLPIGTPLGNVPLITGSVEGNELPQAPEVVVNLTADYTFPLFGGEADSNVTYEHSSGEYFEPDNIIHQPAYGKANLSLKWTSFDSRYSVRFWCNNVSNAATFGAGQSAVNGSQYMQYAPPRTYGITFGYHL